MVYIWRMEINTREACATAVWQIGYLAIIRLNVFLVQFTCIMNGQRLGQKLCRLSAIAGYWPQLFEVFISVDPGRKAAKSAAGQMPRRSRQKEKKNRAAIKTAGNNGCKPGKKHTHTQKEAFKGSGLVYTHSRRNRRMAWNLCSHRQTDRQRGSGVGSHSKQSVRNGRWEERRLAWKCIFIFLDFAHKMRISLCP